MYDDFVNRLTVVERLSHVLAAILIPSWSRTCKCVDDDKGNNDPHQERAFDPSNAPAIRRAILHL
jgi:hypothetical protein